MPPTQVQNHVKCRPHREQAVSGVPHPPMQVPMMMRLLGRWAQSQRSGGAAAMAGHPMRWVPSSWHSPQLPPRVRTCDCARAWRRCLFRSVCSGARLSAAPSLRRVIRNAPRPAGVGGCAPEGCCRPARYTALVLRHAIVRETVSPRIDGEARRRSACKRRPCTGRRL